MKNLYLCAAMVVNPQNGQRNLTSEVIERENEEEAMGYMALHACNNGFVLEKATARVLEGYLIDPSYKSEA